MNFIEKYLEAKKMRALIKEATKTIYSEQSNFESILEKLLSRTDKLRALVAIKVAASINEPVDKKDIKQALEEVNAANNDLREEEEIREFLIILQESIKVECQKRTETILKGKLAFKQNKYSYEASIYHLESIKRGPASQKEKAKWKVLSNELEIAQKNYDDHLQKLREADEEQQSTEAAQASLDKMIAERDERRKYMTPEQIQNEIDQAKNDREELIKQLKEALKKNNGIKSDERNNSMD